MSFNKKALSIVDSDIGSVDCNNSPGLLFKRVNGLRKYIGVLALSASSIACVHNTNVKPELNTDSIVSIELEEIEYVADTDKILFLNTYEDLIKEIKYTNSNFLKLVDIYNHKIVSSPIPENRKVMIYNLIHNYTKSMNDAEINRLESTILKNFNNILDIAKAINELNVFLMDEDDEEKVNELRIQKAKFMILFKQARLNLENMYLLLTIKAQDANKLVSDIENSINVCVTKKEII